jgi:DNA-binding MarR family transcriptional regulator
MLRMARTAEGEALTDLIIEVFRVNGDLLRAGDRIAAPSGQTSSRWQVLGSIDDSPKTVSAIGREMGLTRQSVQRTADLLERDGLVEYVENPLHRRSKLLRLTRSGAGVVRSITERQVEWVDALAREIPGGRDRIEDAVVLLRELRIDLGAGSRDRGEEGAQT